VHGNEADHFWATEFGLGRVQVGAVGPVTVTPATLAAPGAASEKASSPAVSSTRVRLTTRSSFGTLPCGSVSPVARRGLGGKVCGPRVQASRAQHILPPVLMAPAQPLDWPVGAGTAGDRRRECR
jgi:hypothetical protein